MRSPPQKTGAGSWSIDSGHGRSLEALAIAAWHRDLAPSDALRKWFGHVQAEFDRLRSKGVRFTQEPTEMGGVTTAVFDDTCGNLIQIAQMA